jgi:transposase-like protein
LIELTIKRGVFMTKYDKQFRDEAVRLAITSPHPISKTAHDLGINKTTLYSWVSAAKDKSPLIEEKGEKTHIPFPF